jgi:hypothetical protein
MISQFQSLLNSYGDDVSDKSQTLLQIITSLRAPTAPPLRVQRETLKQLNYVEEPEFVTYSTKPLGEHLIQYIH